MNERADLKFQRNFFKDFWEPRWQLKLKFKGNLIFVDAGHDDEVWDEEADEGVAAEGRDVGSNDGVDLADERLNETVQSANLLEE